MAKKKILLLADDLRMASGIANVSKQFVLGTVDKYDWVQLAAAIQHPDMGKVFDLSEEVRKTTGVQDANVKVIAYNGYGDAAGNHRRDIPYPKKPSKLCEWCEFYGKHCEGK